MQMRSMLAGNKASVHLLTYPPRLGETLRLNPQQSSRCAKSCCSETFTIFNAATVADLRLISQTIATRDV